jgi:hypothetical protein
LPAGAAHFATWPASQPSRVSSVRVGDQGRGRHRPGPCVGWGGIGGLGCIYDRQNNPLTPGPPMPPQPNFQQGHACDVLSLNLQRVPNIPGLAGVQATLQNMQNQQTVMQHQQTATQDTLAAIQNQQTATRLKFWTSSTRNCASFLGLGAWSSLRLFHDCFPSLFFCLQYFYSDVLLPIRIANAIAANNLPLTYTPNVDLAHLPQTKFNLFEFTSAYLGYLYNCICLKTFSIVFSPPVPTGSGGAQPPPSCGTLISPSATPTDH